MNKTFNLTLILLLSASCLAMAEDKKAARKVVRGKVAETSSAAGAPSDVVAPVKKGLRLPRLFGDHMILQQNMKNTIWG